MIAINHQSFRRKKMNNNQNLVMIILLIDGAQIGRGLCTANWGELKADALNRQLKIEKLKVKIYKNDSR